MSSEERGKPLVSVVIPAWNAEATLAETLRSVAKQTYRNFEILIVDDGSSDRTAEIAAQFCATEPRARMISKKNGGLASARNAGIAHSKGEWIGPVDADDVWHPTRIEKMVVAALSAPAAPGFVYCWSRHIDREGKVAGLVPRWRVEGFAFNRLAYLNVVGNGSALLLSREAIGEVGGYDPTMRDEHAQGAEDMLVQDRIARRYPVALVPECLVGWRQTGANMSSDAEQMFRACRLVYRRLESDGTPAPPGAARWMLGTAAFDVAERKAVLGKYGGALRWMAESVRRDPLRCGLMLFYRLVRTVSRRLRPATAPTRRRNFYDVEPMDFTIGDVNEIRWFKRLLDRIDERRLKRFAEKDRQMAAASARPS